LIGHQIGGRYRIIQRLGGGGMGVVYQAEDMLLGRDVAIKVLRSHLAEDDAFRHRFAREGRSAAALSHPNIVQVYDVGETPEGVPYLVMEYVSGPTLEKVLAERGALGEREAVDIAAQVAAALAEAHRRGVVHRDIKPLNILVRPDGTVKVADFGIARAQSGATLVNTGTIVGSAHYVSPEQARGGYVDEKTDVYSLGVVLFEMLTGRTPFQGDTAVAVALKHLQDEVPSPSALANVSRRLEGVVLRALEKDPARRYPSAAAFLADLEAVRVGLDQPPGGGRRRPPPAPGRTGIWVPIVAAAIVLMIGVAAFLYSRYVAPQPVTLPRLVGQPATMAEKQLGGLSLKWEIGSFQVDASMPYGNVVASVPKAGSAMLPGRTVRLVLSAGPPPVPGGVPSVEGQQVAAARQELAGVGLNVVQVLPRPSNVYGKGQVIGTLPPAGAAAWVGQDVSLEVSTGTTARTVAMPALVGEALAAWQAALAAQGLSVSEIRYGASSAPAGQVLGQEPAAGTPVSAGSTISLVLSAGAGGSAVAAPDAVQQQSATITLPAKGFRSGTPVMVQVVSEDGAVPVLATAGRPGERLSVTYTWRGDGTMKIWFAGQVVRTLALPVASSAGP
jgi:beta-lactam-binding protein with PASTA domain/predicted Ser/Thr protein kinase